jgi:hypothetical protein
MSYLDPDENDPASKGYKQWRAIRVFSAIALLIAVAMSLLGSRISGTAKRGWDPERPLWMEDRALPPLFTLPR